MLAVTLAMVLASILGRPAKMASMRRQALQAPDPLDRTQAVNWLGRPRYGYGDLLPDYRTIIRVLYEDPDGSVRETAAQVLGINLGNSRHLPLHETYSRARTILPALLRAGASDSDPRVRASSLSAAYVSVDELAYSFGLKPLVGEFLEDLVRGLKGGLTDPSDDIRWASRRRLRELHERGLLTDLPDMGDSEPRHAPPSVRVEPAGARTQPLAAP